MNYRVFITIQSDDHVTLHESESPTVDFAIEKLGQFERSQEKMTKEEELGLDVLEGEEYEPTKSQLNPNENE